MWLNRLLIICKLIVKIKMPKNKVSISDVNFNQMMKSKAIKNNKLSGKLIVPKDMIDKEVFVL